MTSYSHKESQEMYLKAILTLLQKHGSVRAVDVCEETGYARSSVSRALAILERDRYIVRGDDRTIMLTERGRNTAQFVSDRYTVVRRMLMCFGLTEEEAGKTACDIEHYISKDIYEKLKATLDDRDRPAATSDR